MNVPLGKTKYALAFLLVLLTVSSLLAQRVREGSVPEGQKHIPNGDGSTTLVPDTGAAPSGQAVVTGNGINYNGGPVLKGTVPIYIIWYGNWNGTGSNTQTTVNLIDTLIGGLSNSGYEKINSTYGDNTGNVSGAMTLVKQVFDTGSQGTKLRNNKISAAISAQLTSGNLPTDPNGVYLFLTSSDVSESGFCSQFCGFHTRQTLNGADIKWAFIGNVDRCPSGCEIQTTGPNSTPGSGGGADGMANVIGHETEEAISDPDLNAWFDNSGQENADKCNFRFGATQTAANSARFNQTLGGKNWMIQMNWENSRGGGCAQTLGGPFQ